MPLCECGCGEPIVPRPHHQYKPVRFLPGHHYRSPAVQAKRRAKIQLTPPPGFVRSGFCECGCGRRTRIAKQSRPEWEQYAGYPMRFIHGHSHRGRRGTRWKGGRTQDPLGYWLVFRPHHPAARSGGYVLEHRLIWEETHGRLLRLDEHVHHLDGNPSNNDPANLVALTSDEHVRLHARSHETSKRKSLGQRRRRQQPGAHERNVDAAKRGWETRRRRHQRMPTTSTTRIDGDVPLIV